MEFIKSVSVVFTRYQCGLPLVERLLVCLKVLDCSYTFFKDTVLWSSQKAFTLSGLLEGKSNPRFFLLFNCCFHG